MSEEYFSISFLNFSTTSKFLKNIKWCTLPFVSTSVVNKKYVFLS